MGEVGALQRRVAGLGAEPPGQPDEVAEAVGLADQPEAEVREARLDAGDHRVDAIDYAGGNQTARYTVSAAALNTSRIQAIGGSASRSLR